MARGRFVDKGTCLDKKINSFSVESELGFILLLTHTDCEGRVFGDPEVVKSLIFPRRKEITIDMVEGFIKEWQSNEMVFWYEYNGDKYIQFVNFEKHQIGLRKDREVASDIPEYTAKDCRNDDGIMSENIPLKLKVKLKDKPKLSEDKGELRGNILDEEFKSMHKTIFNNTFNDEWWRVMEEAPKELDGETLKVKVDNQRIIEEVNKRSRVVQKQIVNCGLSFRSFILEGEYGEVGVR